MLRRVLLKTSAFVAVVCSALLALPAAAQDRLFVFGADVELGTAGRFGEPVGPFPEALRRELVGGGRYGVGNTDVIDRRTGERIPLPLSVPVAYDRARPRVFLLVFEPTPGVAVFDAETRTSSLLLAVPDLRASPPPVHYAPHAELLFVLNGVTGSGTDFRAEYVAIDSRDGRPVRHVRLPRYVSAVTPDASRLFATIGLAPVQAFDGVTGAQVAEVNVGGIPRWIDAADLLFLSGGTRVALYDRDLQEVAGFDEIDGKCPARLAVSPHTKLVYLFTGGGDYYGFSFNADLSVIDPSGTQPRRDVSLTETLSLGRAACQYPVLMTAPGAPRRLAATVTGRDVALSWQNVGGASHFVLEAGLAPGRTDLSVTLGPDSHASFASVPPGTYYLRLRGGNEFGGGRPSQEIRVVVP